MDTKGRDIKAMSLTLAIVLATDNLDGLRRLAQTWGVREPQLPYSHSFTHALAVTLAQYVMEQSRAAPALDEPLEGSA